MSTVLRDCKVKEVFKRADLNWLINEVPFYKQEEIKEKVKAFYNSIINSPDIETSLLIKKGYPCSFVFPEEKCLEYYKYIPISVIANGKVDEKVWDDFNSDYNHMARSVMIEATEYYTHITEPERYYYQDGEGCNNIYKPLRVVLEWLTFDHAAWVFWLIVSIAILILLEQLKLIESIFKLVEYGIIVTMIGFVGILLLKILNDVIEIGEMKIGIKKARIALSENKYFWKDI